MRRETKTKALVLAACLVGHLAAFVWLHRYAPASAPVVSAPKITQVTWIEATPEPAPPPMPRRSHPSTSTHRISAPTLYEPRLMPPSVETRTEASAPVLEENHHRLTDQWETLDLIPEKATRWRPDPMKPLAPRLPGSGEAIVQGFQLRRERSPADIVRFVGGLFGGNYDPCPDIQGKLHDATVLRPDKYRDSERSALVERERRCRYR